MRSGVPPKEPGPMPGRPAFYRRTMRNLKITAIVILILILIYLALLLLPTVFIYISVIIMVSILWAIVSEFIK